MKRSELDKYLGKYVRIRQRYGEYGTRGYKYCNIEGYLENSLHKSTHYTIYHDGINESFVPSQIMKLEVLE